MNITRIDLAYLINLRTRTIRKALNTLVEVPNDVIKERLSRMPDRIDNNKIAKSN